MGRTVALDIGTTQVRAIEVVHQKNSKKIRHATHAPLPQGVISDGQIRQPDMLTGAIKALWRGTKFSTRNVSLTVGWYPKVLIRPLELQYLDNPKDMSALVLANASTAIPQEDMNALQISHHIVGVRNKLLPEDQTMKVADVAVVGANKETINDLTNCVMSAGLTPRNIDVSLFVLARLTNPQPNNELNIIVQLGAHTSMLTAVLNGQPIAQRPFNHLSGIPLTNAIASRFAISLEQAEALKVGYQPNNVGLDHNPGSAIAQWVGALIKEISTEAVELSKRFNKPITRIWLSGGGAKLHGLTSRLAADPALNTQVTIIDPALWATNSEKMLPADIDFSVAFASAK